MHKNSIPVTMGMPKNLGKNSPDDPSVLIDGINLSKPEFEKVAKVFNALLKKYGYKYSTQAEIIDAFKSEMRQKFTADIAFEKVGKRQEIATELIACRFKKDRPLIYLILMTDTNDWTIIDEKRFQPLDEKSPFLPVNI